MQHSFIKNVKEHKERSVLFIKKAKERENVSFFWKERKRTQKNAKERKRTRELCILLKTTDAQPWLLEKQTKNG